MSSIPRAAWSRPTSDDEAARRAAGRARYNAWRRFLKVQRRRLVADLVAAGMSRRDIAAALGAAPRTIRRDVAAILAEADMTLLCPVCGGGPFLEDDGQALPWRRRGAMIALRRAAAWKAGEYARALGREVEADVLEKDQRIAHQSP